MKPFAVIFILLFIFIREANCISHHILKTGRLVEFRSIYSDVGGVKLIRKVLKLTGGKQNQPMKTRVSVDSVEHI